MRERKERRKPCLGFFKQILDPVCNHSFLRQERQHISLKNTKYKYTIKTYKNRGLQNREQQNPTAYIYRETDISKFSTSN